MDLEICLEGLVKLVMTSYRPGEMSVWFGDDKLDLEKCLDGLVKVVMTSYRLG